MLDDMQPPAFDPLIAVKVCMAMTAPGMGSGDILRQGVPTASWSIRDDLSKAFVVGL